MFQTRNKPNPWIDGKATRRRHPRCLRCVTSCSSLEFMGSDFADGHCLPKIPETSCSMRSESENARASAQRQPRFPSSCLVLVSCLIGGFPTKRTSAPLWLNQIRIVTGFKPSHLLDAQLTDHVRVSNSPCHSWHICRVNWNVGSDNSANM